MYYLSYAVMIVCTPLLIAYLLIIDSLIEEQDAP